MYWSSPHEKLTDTAWNPSVQSEGDCALLAAVCLTALRETQFEYRNKAFQMFSLVCEDQINISLDFVVLECLPLRITLLDLPLELHKNLLN